LITIEFKNNKEVINFLRDNKKALLKTLFIEIKDSKKNGNDIAIGANLIVNDEVLTIAVEKKDWLKHLIVSMDYFLQIEDYEMCASIRDLINII
jgi:protein-arginine kinase activator protein McsA